MTNLAVFASHNGSGFDALYAHKNELKIKIVLVISNNPHAKILEKAKELGITTKLINASTSQNPDVEIEKMLHSFDIKYVFLSGYMKKISANLTQNFKIINSHPSLLPKYGGQGMYGHYVHEAVIKNGEKQSGVTIHEVNKNLDEGEIIYQKSLKLNPNETSISLEKRVKELEQSAIIEGFKRYLSS